MDVKGKGAVVTGAGSGIGAGIAEALVAAGANVVIADIEAERAQAVADRLSGYGGNVAAFACDVRDISSMTALADFAWERLGGVQILCNNAGVVTHGPAFDSTPADLRWIFEVNVFGAWNGLKVFGPRFLEAGERSWICNTGSHHSIGAPTSGISLYVATKHAVLGLCEAIRTEYGDRIGVSILCPGIVSTNLWNSGRNRPDEHGGAYVRPEESGQMSRDYGLSPRLVGDLVVKGIDQEDFWIWTHPQDMDLIQKRYDESMESIQRQWPDGPTEIHHLTPTHVE